MDSEQDIVIRFGKRVRELREQRMWSQEAFAFECELDRTYISGIERGVRNISVRNVYAVAKGLRVSLSELFEGLD